MKKGKYLAVLFTQDGSDYQTDCYTDTIEEVNELLSDMGSRWIFYPIAVIIRNNYENVQYFQLKPQTKIQNTAYPFMEQMCKDKYVSIKNFRQMLKEYCCCNICGNNTLLVRCNCH